MDALANLAVATVATAPSPATSGTSLTLTTGQGARFPAPPFNVTVWTASSGLPTIANAEIIRVTAASGDTWSTIARAQEGTTARSILAGDTVILALTKKYADDLVTLIGTKLDTTAASATYGRKFAPTVKTTGYTAAVGDLVLADATSAGFTVTLPASPTAGDVVGVKKTDAGANIVTVAAAGKTVDGDPNATLVSQNSGGLFTYDGTNWQVTAVTQTAVSAGGGAVTSVVGQTGAVTGAQILADASVSSALSGKLGTTAQAADSAKIAGIAVTGTPTAGQVPTATSGTAATWQTPAGGGGGVSKGFVIGMALALG